MNKIMSAVYAFAALLNILQCTEAQKVHVVGGNLGWTVPSSDKSAYQTWAAGQNFSVGDILMFSFPTNIHDVFEVSKESYETCNSKNPMTKATNGPANITIDRSGEHYYLCSINDHCDGGQKLAINVSSGGSYPSPADSPTPPPPPPSPSSAPTTSASASFLLLFFSTIMVIMF